MQGNSVLRWCNTQVHCPGKVCEAPVTDAGFPVRCNIGRKKTAERGIQLHSASQVGAAVICIRVTTDAAGNIYQVFTPIYIGFRQIVSRNS